MNTEKKVKVVKTKKQLVVQEEKFEENVEEKVEEKVVELPDLEPLEEHRKILSVIPVLILMKM